MTKGTKLVVSGKVSLFGIVVSEVRVADPQPPAAQPTPTSGGGGVDRSFHFFP